MKISQTATDGEKAIAAAEPPLSVQRPLTLEALLDALSQVGRPRLSLMHGGWYCAVEMFVSAVGAEFKVASEFRHKTPFAAALQCHDRAIDALKTSSGGED